MNYEKSHKGVVRLSLPQAEKSRDEERLFYFIWMEQLKNAEIRTISKS